MFDLRITHVEPAAFFRPAQPDTARPLPNGPVVSRYGTTLKTRGRPSAGNLSAGTGYSHGALVPRTRIRWIPYNIEIIRTRLKHAVALLAMVLVTFLLGYLIALSVRIGRESTIDEARPSDVIVVMGAAEYRGRPSPVLKLRLDRAAELYSRRLAPYIMTTGGSGGDPSFTESGVGRSYLIDRGVPAEAIVVEDEGASTASSLTAASEILRRMGLRTCIIVSDGYHLFRVKRILRQAGFTVYGSPREAGDTPEYKRWYLYFRQAVGYGLWKIGFRV
jgi:uncharacterized SAM-binding protein YcdF (DUF218 family)